MAETKAYPVAWMVVRDSECDPPEFFATEEAARKNACLGLADTHVMPLFTGAAAPSLPSQESSEVATLKVQLADAHKDAESWKSHWKMYRDAWIRELGGWLIPKAHEIDALVLTTRRRCVNPILGNCSTPHWLGKPTEDKTALQQTPHPMASDCRDWAALSSDKVSKEFER